MYIKERFDLPCVWLLILGTLTSLPFAVLAVESAVASIGWHFSSRTV